MKVPGFTLKRRFTNQPFTTPLPHTLRSLRLTRLCNPNGVLRYPGAVPAPTECAVVSMESANVATTRGIAVKNLTP